MKNKIWDKINSDEELVLEMYSKNEVAKILESVYLQVLKNPAVSYADLAFVKTVIDSEIRKLG